METHQIERLRAEQTMLSSVFREARFLSSDLKSAVIRSYDDKIRDCQQAIKDKEQTERMDQHE